VKHETSPGPYRVSVILVIKINRSGGNDRQGGFFTQQSGAAQVNA